MAKKYSARGSKGYATSCGGFFAIKHSDGLLRLEFVIEHKP